MPPKTQVAPEHTANGLDDPDIPAHSVHAIQSFIETIRELTSHDDYKQVTNHFNEITQLRQEVENKAKDLEAYKIVNATLAKDQSSLKTKLEERNNTIAKAKKQEESLQGQVNQLEEKSNKQKEAMKKAAAKTKDLENAFKAIESKATKLENICRQEKGKSSQLGDELTGVKQENESLVQKLEANRSRLAELEGFALELNEVDPEAPADTFETLWEHACTFVESYFEEDLPEVNLQNGAWDRLRTPKHFQHNVPLPQTNSVPAKQMRIAVILAILARSLDRYFFHPTYICEEDCKVRSVLLRQAVHNSKKESFCRALLLSMFPEEQETTRGQRMESVIDDVMWAVKELLTPAKVESFQSELKAFVEDAGNTWKTMQHIRERFEPSFDLVRVEGYEWQTLLFDTNATGEPAIQGGRDDELLVVFPRLYIVEKNHEPEPLSTGTVLRRSQSLEAAQELEKQPLSPTFGRAMLTRTRPQKSRNLSISIHGERTSEAKAFLDQGRGPSEH